MVLFVPYDTGTPASLNLIDVSAPAGLKALLKQQHFCLPIESGLAGATATVACR